MDKWANDAIYTKDGSKLISIPKRLTSFKIKDGTKIIGGNAFSGCSSLQSVAIPKNTVVADNAFPETTTIIRK